MFRDQERYGRDPNVVVRSKTTFGDPLKWRDPHMIFTCSYSDWFIEEADEWRDEAWEIIRHTPWHIYLILTKRPENIRYRLPHQGFPPRNVWWGVTIENQDTENTDRWHSLYEEIGMLGLKTFISAEPLLGPLDLSSKLKPDLKHYRPDWVIVGGESGPGYRQMELEWAIDLVNQCKSANIPAFVKQLGGWPDKQTDIEKFPRELQVREWPA
jgi:protein gp37